MCGEGRDSECERVVLRDTRKRIMKLEREHFPGREDADRSEGSSLYTDLPQTESD